MGSAELAVGSNLAVFGRHGRNVFDRVD
jgi:hypothetical protein